jgi:hypothetical protein
MACDMERKLKIHIYADPSNLCWASEKVELWLAKEHRFSSEKRRFSWIVNTR